MSEPAIIFDLGKVLVDFDYSIAERKIAARSTKSPKELHSFLGSSPLLVEYESGQINRSEFYEAVRAAIGYQGSVEEFGGYFADIFSEMPATISLHAQLKSEGFKTFIFSNTNDLAIEHIRKNFPFFANFDGYVFSYEVRAMKPQPLIYEAMEKLCGRDGGDLVYIDDRPENIAGGAQRGWRTVLHTSATETRATLIRFGLPAE